MAAAGLRVHPWLSFAAAGFAFLLVMFVAGCESPDESATNVDPVRSDYFSYPRESRLPPCAPFLPEERGNFVRWSRDGSAIVFQRGDKLYHTVADGSAVRLIDTEPTTGWHAFDLSPEGRQIVYSACPNLDGNRYVFPPGPCQHRWDGPQDSLAQPRFQGFSFVVARRRVDRVS